MRVVKSPLGPQARLDADFADSLHVPAIDVLFSSAADSFGSGTLAVLLTGLGRDGTSGMLRVREAGGYTIGEAESTAASYSMPGSAAEAGAVVQELPLDRIGARLSALAAPGR
jgi:two-component system chemotaxis response regulator CheB